MDNAWWVAHLSGMYHAFFLSFFLDERTAVQAIFFFSWTNDVRWECNIFILLLFQKSWHSILEFWISGVEVEINNSSTKADPLTVGLGFFLGVLIGAVIAVFCAKLCLKDIARSKVIEPRHAKHPTKDLYCFHTKRRMHPEECPSFFLI